MRDLIILLVHPITTVLRIAQPGGSRSVIAESVLIKHQLLIVNRSRRRAPNLRVLDRLIAGSSAKNLTRVLGTVSSRSDFLKPVFMMETVENRCRHNAAIGWNAMSLKLKFSLRRSSVGHTRSQAGMWARPIVMFHPRSERLSNVSLVHGNDEIQTLSTRCPNQSFAIGIGLRRFVRRLQDRQP